MHIKIVSKPGCLYCDQAKEFLNELGLAFETEHLDPNDDATYKERRGQLVATTQSKTFPFIFVDGEYLGGFQDLVMAHGSGRLQELCSKYNITLPEVDF